MATKTITITESAYERSKAFKRDDESFNDVIERLIRNNHVWRGRGAWTDTGFAEAVEAERETFDADVQERDRQL